MKPTNDATTAAKELFAERLKDKLAEYDIKQNALAEDLGVSESTVGKWILGKSMPRTMGMVEKIADRLHVGKSYFLEEKPTPVKEELSGHERQHLELYRALDDEGRRQPQNGPAYSWPCLPRRYPPCLHPQDHPAAHRRHRQHLMRPCICYRYATSMLPVTKILQTYTQLYTQLG